MAELNKQTDKLKDKLINQRSAALDVSSRQRDTVGDTDGEHTQREREFEGVK